MSIIDLGASISEMKQAMEGLSWFERQKIYWINMFVPEMDMLFKAMSRGMKVEDLMSEAEIKKEVATRKEKVAKRVASFESELVVEWDTTWSGVKLNHLPGDRLVKGKKLNQREGKALKERLRKPFFENFQAPQ